MLQAALGMMFYLAALRHTTVASVAVIYATTPLLAGLLSFVVLRERPRPSAVLGTVLALVGVAVMVGFAPQGDLTGDLLALGMALSMAVTTVVARNFPEIPVLLSACLASLFSGLLSWPFGTPLQVSGHRARCCSPPSGSSTSRLHCRCSRAARSCCRRSKPR